MNQIYYYLIFFLLGGIFSAGFMYAIINSLARERFRIYSEKHKIARFISSMRKLHNKGENKKIANSIDKFSAICIYFSSESFEALQMKDIANIMKAWELEFFMPPFSQNGALPRYIDLEIFSSENEKRQKMIDMLYMAIGI